MTEKISTRERVEQGVSMLRGALEDYDADGDEVLLNASALVAGAWIAGISPEEVNAALEQRKFRRLVAALKKVDLAKITDEEVKDGRD